MENFIMDLIILFASLCGSSEKIRILFVVSGALLGGIYSVCSEIVMFLNILPVKLTVAFLLCAVSVRFSSLRCIADLFIRFISISFIIAGCCFAIDVNLSKNGIISYSYLLKYLITSVITGLFIFYSLIKRCYIPKNKCTVEVDFGSHTSVFFAIPDQCTVLKDHTGGGVIIADRKLFPDHIPELLSDKKIKKRTFHIRTAAGVKTLIGIMPKKLLITENTDRYIARAYIVLSDDIDIDGCSALIGRGLKMTREKEISDAKTFDEYI